MALVFYTDSGRLSRKYLIRVQCRICRDGKLTLTAHFLFHLSNALANALTAPITASH